jgi:hypothetical protein
VLIISAPDYLFNNKRGVFKTMKPIRITINQTIPTPDFSDKNHRRGKTGRFRQAILAKRRDGNYRRNNGGKKR